MSAAHANDTIVNSSGTNITIATPTTTSRTITQTGQPGARDVINWTSLNVASGHTLNFVQPSASSIVLNRVVGPQGGAITPTQINGTISANGQVWILNPMGVLVGSAGSINVAGFLATTLGLTDDAFATGNSFSLSGTSMAAVINGGSIIMAESGYAVLAGNRVENSGLIQAEMGTIALGSGQAISVSFSNDKLISFAVPQSALGTGGGLVQASTGILIADGGRVLMTARAAANTAATVINVDGLVQAQTVSVQNGQIVLDAGTAGVTDIRGKLFANGLDANEKGGTITVTGQRVNAFANSQVLARGLIGGGSITVGQFPVTGVPATPTSIHAAVGSTFDASAIQSGSGGSITLLSDYNDQGSLIKASGAFYADGGASGGAGGSISASFARLDLTNLDASLLEKPFETAALFFYANNIIVSQLSGGFGQISTGEVGSILNAGRKLTLTAFGQDANAGNINIDSGFSKTSNLTSSITFSARNNISQATGANVSSTSGVLKVSFQSDSSTADLTLGAINIAGPITAQGGNVFVTGALTTAGSSAVTLTGTQSIDLKGGGSIVSGTGNVSLTAPLLFVRGGSGSGIQTGGNISVVTSEQGNLNNDHLRFSNRSFDATDISILTNGGFNFLLGLKLNNTVGLDIADIGNLNATGTLTLGSSVDYSALVPDGLNVCGSNCRMTVVSGFNLVASDLAGNLKLTHRVIDSNSGSSFALGTGQSLTLANFGSQGATSNFESSISGTGSLIKVGAAALKLSGANTYSGGTTISAGTLTGTTTSFGTGAIANNSALVFDQPSNASYAGDIAGTGSLTKLGAGNLTLSGTNTYSGDTTISDGTLTGTTTSFGAGAIANSGAVVFNQAANASFAGVILGTGSLTKLGAGNLTLGGANTYTGATTISAGTVQAGSASALGASAGLVSVSAGGALDLNGFSIANALNLAGSGLNDSGALFNSSSAAATAGGAITLTADTTIKNNGALILAGTVNGAFALNAQNTGELTFANAVGSSGARLSSLTVSGDAILYGNVFTSGAQIYDGNLGVATSSLDSSDGGVTIAGNLTGLATTAILEFLGGGTYRFNGSTFSTAGTQAQGLNVSFAGDNYTWTPVYTGPAQLLVAGGGGAGGWSDSSSQGGGGGGGVAYAPLLNLNAGSTYVVSVGAGGVGSNTPTFTSGSDSSFALVGGTLAVTAFGGGTGGGFDGDEGAPGGSGGGGHWVGSGAGGAASQGSFTGITGVQLFGNTGGSSNLLTTGGGGGGGASAAGTSATSDGTGGSGGEGFSSTISGQAVVYGSGGAGMGSTANGTAGTNAGASGARDGTTAGGDGLPNSGGGGGAGSFASKSGDGGSGVVVVNYSTSASLTINAGTGAVSIGGAVSNLTALSVGSNANATSQITGTLTGSTRLTKAGSGTLVLSGNNSYSGGTTISAGTLTGTASNSFGTGAIANSAALVFDQNANASFTGVISGTGSLTKLGAGNLILSGTNTYGGVTRIDAGVLQIGSEAQLGTGSITMAGGTLRFVNSGAVSLTKPVTLVADSAIEFVASTTLGLQVTWSGTRFQNEARAIGLFDADINLLPGRGSVTNLGSFGTGFALRSLNIQNAESGNGSFSQADFQNFVFFQAVGPLDYSRELIGQTMANGFNFGSFEGGYEGPSGDFNIFGASGLGTNILGASPNAPSGTFFFELTTAARLGDKMAVISILPEKKAPTSTAANVTGTINGDFGLRIVSDGNLAIAGNLGTTQALARLSAKATGELRLGATAQIRATGDISLSALTRFINQSTAANVLSSSAGSWRVYSGNLDPFSPTTGDETGALDHQFRAYNYQPTSAVNDFHTVGLSGQNGLLYRFAPQVSLEPTTPIVKAYDGTRTVNPTLLNFSLSGGVNGDLLTLSGTPSGQFETANASPTTMAISGLQLSAVDSANKPVFGYAFTPSVAATITPQPLTVRLTGSVQREYDGTTTAALSASNLSLDGVVSGESVSVTQTQGQFASPNAGSGLTVLAAFGNNDFAAGTGTLLSNYSLPTSASGAIGIITPRALSLTISGELSKVYDGLASITLSPAGISLTGLISNETITVTKTDATLASANVGSGVRTTLTL
ncbi:autotransporter-associated beta strand repeat-containing protein, partial [Sandarakinorhabdus limnophila]|uniref:autotransporter-associated beta strand repeat-containing protein n=1 Tax=Sandarakinorhabdus limnophila TaxID=210512 RepID=UPI003137C72A